MAQPAAPNKPKGKTVYVSMFNENSDYSEDSDDGRSEIVRIDPAETSFSAAGGNITVKIVSTSESKLAFKVRTSNNAVYRVKPVFGFIAPKADSPLEIMRLTGPPKDDKLVVQWAEVPAEVKDPKGAFKIKKVYSQAVLPMKAT